MSCAPPRFPANLRYYRNNLRYRETVSPKNPPLIPLGAVGFSRIWRIIRPVCIAAGRQLSDRQPQGPPVPVPRRSAEGRWLRSCASPAATGRSWGPCGASPPAPCIRHSAPPLTAGALRRLGLLPLFDPPQVIVPPMPWPPRLTALAKPCALVYNMYPVWTASERVEHFNGGQKFE